ncbi:MAG: AMP-binding protein [Candidatus Omnitrophica bacterium]|nr:AMP-binding protein [Candidatus Omnitrophota bacterium]
MDIAQLFRDVAEKMPQKPFLIFRDQPISYSEGVKMVNKLANALNKMGVKKGEKVAVYLPNSPQYVFSYLAVFSLGAACVPLDVRLTDEELIGVLNHSEASVFITKALEKNSFAELMKKVSRLKHIIKCFSDEEDGFASFNKIMQQQPDKQIEINIDEGSLAILYYTSGTTGNPKAVMSNYRSLDNAAQTIRYIGLNEENTGDVSICALPLSHLGGFVYIQFGLDMKMSIVLMERFIPLEFLRQIERHKVTWFHLVPPMFIALLQLKEFEKYDFTSLKGVDLFGAPSHPDLMKRFGKYCPNAILWHGWGMTETAAPNTVTGPENIASIGKNPPWFEMKIFDNDDKEVPVGEIGEIVCRGWPVMMGYYKEPEMTAEIMRNGWLHTGDLGCVDKDGYFYIKGRKKDMIIVGGLNVYSPELEHVISEHPQVAEVAVIGVADKLRGEAVKAVIVLKEGQKISGKDIKAFCRERLVHFKVPQIVEFRDSLPKTRSGKIAKEALKQDSLVKDSA